jgi:hypothetical protein
MKYSKEDTCVVSGHPSGPTVNSPTITNPTVIGSTDVSSTITSPTVIGPIDVNPTITSLTATHVPLVENTFRSFVMHDLATGL